ncbi:MAG: hypothetical protein ACOYEH_03425 [Caldicoprobacterales bacterium]|jgi:hypothetical protein|nr:hypothetical protein [Clostridiales bacterium]
MVDEKEIESYQELLNKIPGIINTRIIVGEDGNLKEIHVLSDLSRGPKQIVRDVQSALIAGCNLSVDHKIISVAQVEDNRIGIQEFRLAIDSIQVFSRKGKMEACVLLKNDDQVYEGIAVGGNSALGRLRVVAEAVLRAIHKFLNQEFLFVLSDVVRINLADRKAIAVSILHFSSQGEEYLSGLAFIRNDENEAVVKASLSAINRRLTVYMDKV